MRASHAKILIASTLAIVGVGIAWRALSSGGRPTSTTSPPEPIPTEGFPDLADVKFDADPAREPVERIVERVRERLTQILLSEHPDWAASAARHDGLVALVGERVQLLLAPEYDLWVEHIRRFGGEEREPTPEFLTRWENASSRLAGVPLSIGQIWGRDRWRGGVMVEATMTPIYMASSMSGRYEAERMSPEASRLDVYEVLIPMGFKSRDAKRYDNKVFVGLQFAWMEDDSKWSPYEMILYRPMSAFNGEWILGPVF